MLDFAENHNEFLYYYILWLFVIEVCISCFFLRITWLKVPMSIYNVK